MAELLSLIHRDKYVKYVKYVDTTRTETIGLQNLKCRLLFSFISSLSSTHRAAHIFRHTQEPDIKHLAASSRSHNPI
jgi:hypothetical protein